jgi:hypothetical protein
MLKALFVGVLFAQVSPEPVELQGLVQQTADGFALATPPAAGGPSPVYHLIFDQGPVPQGLLGRQVAITGITLVDPQARRSYLVVRSIQTVQNADPQPKLLVSEVGSWQVVITFTPNEQPLLRLTGVVECPSPGYHVELVILKKFSYGLRLGVKMTKLQGSFPDVVTKVPVVYSIKGYSGNYKWISIQDSDGNVTRINLGVK